MHKGAHAQIQQDDMHLCVLADVVSGLHPQPRQATFVERDAFTFRGDGSSGIRMPCAPELVAPDDAEAKAKEEDRLVISRIGWTTQCGRRSVSGLFFEVKTRRHEPPVIFDVEGVQLVNKQRALCVVV
ncbi:hypothetical protein PHYPSEUDO_007861 [Phytophthora pseudosyringae]|uniref:Uncharacterized protein n=1 Tax=Phytophthora pseudosyringae TaxID=221518 RepID=A0A8T1VKU2_9STRA|nr:hypothetical protein PHYPSEUDO_007861 [Phytophthora pseudosyringae]